MKKLLPAILLCCTLVSCQGTSKDSSPISSSTSDTSSSITDTSSSSSSAQTPLDKSLDATLSRLSKGFHLELVRTEKYVVTGGSGSETNYYGYEEIQVDDENYRQTLYRSSTTEASKDIIEQDQWYLDQNGTLVVRQFSLQNEVVETVADRNKNFVSAGLQNAFLSAQASYFTESNSSFVLNDTASETFTKRLTKQLYGYTNMELSLADLSLSYDGDTLGFEASLDPFTISYMTTIEVTLSFKGVFLSTEVDADPIVPIQGNDHSELDTAFDKISTWNFKTNVVNEEILYQDGRYETVATAEGSVLTNQFYYAFYDEDDVLVENNLYYLTNEKMQKAAIYGEKIYASGEPVSASVSSYWPSFNISSAFFSKNGDTYQLNTKYLGLFTSTSLFTPFVSDTISSLSIQLEDDKLTIINENSGNGRTTFGAKETITYSDFGKATAMDVSSVNEDSSSLTWKEALRNPNDYRTIARYLGESNLNEIPFFRGKHGEASLISESNIYALLTPMSAMSEQTTLESQYDTALQELGYTVTTGTDGKEYTKTVGTKTLTIAPYAYEETNILTGTSTGRYYFALLLQAN